MGTLTLPISGTVYIDANTIIYRVEDVQPYVAISMPLWNALRNGIQDVVTSELSLLEVLVKPIQLGDRRLQQLFRAVLYNTRGFLSIPIDIGVTQLQKNVLTLRELLYISFLAAKPPKKRYIGISFGGCAPKPRSKAQLRNSYDNQILQVAAQLRSTTGLKTPDAIHVATALEAGCTLFVTNDPVFRRVPGLNVAILNEIAAAP